ncbi:hypothetical protein G6F68_021682 [Rhizopus microsporus]|nr:hypothetical protein G6F68_021682 [Rhizopus microsporus]
MRLSAVARSTESSLTAMPTSSSACFRYWPSLGFSSTHAAAPRLTVKRLPSLTGSPAASSSDAAFLGSKG